MEAYIFNIVHCACFKTSYVSHLGWFWFIRIAWTTWIYWKNCEWANVWWTRFHLSLSFEFYGMLVINAWKIQLGKKKLKDTSIIFCNKLSIAHESMRNDETSFQTNWSFRCSSIWNKRRPSIRYDSNLLCSFFRALKVTMEMMDLMERKDLR